MSEKQTAPLHANLELPFLTGMRGWAAAWVMAAHVTGTFLTGLPYPVDHILRLGPNGIFIFFVLSAFTITLSLQAGFSATEYAVKRFFRIAPAYYLMLVAMLFLGGSYWAVHFTTPYDLKSFAYHITFMNWIDFRHANNAIGVEWTLSIEMLYYLLLPAIIAVSKSWQGGIALIAVGLMLLFLPHPSEISEAHKWAPWPYLICFVAGAITFRLWNAAAGTKVFANGILVPLAIFALLLSPKPGNFEFDLLWWSLLTCTLILCGRSAAMKLVFENKAALFLGRISYSLYLVHLPIASIVLRFSTGWFATVLTFVASLAIATVLHRYVEVKGQLVGKSLLVTLPSRLRTRSNFTVHNARAVG